MQTFDFDLLIPFVLIMVPFMSGDFANPVFLSKLTERTHPNMKRIQEDYLWMGGLVTISLALRFLTISRYGFHRDEFLYISQGQHLDWGFWSNPPGPAFFSWLTQMILGDSIMAIRFFPGMLGGLTILLVCLIAREMGGGRFAQMLAGFSMMVSNAMPRVFLMFNPVPFDVFYWTLFAYLITKYLSTTNSRYIILLGIAAGLGMLNKYSTIFFILPALPILLLTQPKSLLKSRSLYISGLIFLVIILPNLFWQWRYGFPVIGHMNELARTQLVNVKASAFFSDQILFNASVLIIWISGLWFLLFEARARRYKPIGFIFIGIIILLLVLKGKSYYTMGAYPMLFAAGGCMWEQWAAKKLWLKILVPTLCVVLFQFTLPFSVPYLSLDKMVAYGREMAEKGLDGLVRWEDGKIHDLPQDYADMLGWEDLGDLVIEATTQIEDPTNCIIYCENFGQAGAVSYYTSKQGIPAPVSFADAFVFWLPEKINPSVQDFIYVNDELGADVDNLFEKIIEIGQVGGPYAREAMTRVYLCQQPKSSLAEFWLQRVSEVKSARALPFNHD